MSTQALISIVGLIIIGLVSYIWHDMARRVRELAAKVDSSTQAVLAVKVKRLEGDYFLLHSWKNSILPDTLTRQSENILNVMHRIEGEVQRRIDRLERDMKR